MRKDLFRWPAAATGLLALALLGCSAPQLRSTVDGSTLAEPPVYPANDREAHEFCDFEARNAFQQPENQTRARVECRGVLANFMRNQRAACEGQRQLDARKTGRTPALNAQYESCLRRGTVFADAMRDRRRYHELLRLQTESQLRSFLEAQRTSDSAALATEAQARLARHCGPVLPPDATAKEAHDWRDRFALVGPSQCVAHHAAVRRVLLRVSFAQAQGNLGALDRFIAEVGSEDPDGLKPQAREQAAALFQAQEQRAVDELRSWAQAEAFLSSFGADPRSSQGAKARQIRDALRAEELARLRTEPLLSLRQRLASDAATMPPEWAGLVEKTLAERGPVEERALVATLDPAALREFLDTRSPAAKDPARQASAEGLAMARSRLLEHLAVLIAKGSDAEREALLKDDYINAELRSRAAGRLRADYIQKREFAPLIRLYGLTQDVSLLTAAQAHARSTGEKAQLEKLAVALLKVPARLFEVRGEFDASSASSDVQKNMGFFANFTASVYKPLKGTLHLRLRPDAPIRLSYGTYKLTVTVDIHADRQRTLRSGVLGNQDSAAPFATSKTFQLTLSPPSYAGSVRFDFGAQQLGYFQSGSAGGFTAIQLQADPVASATVSAIQSLQ